MDAIANGRPHTNLGILRGQMPALPPLDEQRAIAHILGTLDDKIELNRRMNETLEAMARALFKSWFVDFDPVRAKAEGRDPGLPKPLADLFPDSFEDSELGEIPKGWEVRRLSALMPPAACPTGAQASLGSDRAASTTEQSRGEKRGKTHEGTSRQCPAGDHAKHRKDKPTRHGHGPGLRRASSHQLPGPRSLGDARHWPPRNEWSRHRSGRTGDCKPRRTESPLGSTAAQTAWDSNTTEPTRGGEQDEGTTHEGDTGRKCPAGDPRRKHRARTQPTPRHAAWPAV